MKKNPLLGRDVISMRDFGREEVLAILARCRDFEKNRKALLEGRVLANLFFEPSTRTRLSFDAAMKRLGGQTIGFADAVATSISKGESLWDTIRVAEGYCDVIVIRHPAEGSARLAAEATKLPVINGGDGSNQHPTQTLLDLYTLKKRTGRLEKLKVAFVGDLKYGRTVHSLTTALSRFGGCTLRFVAPESLQIPAEYLEELQARGVPYTLHARLEEVVPDTDVLYMTRIQRERMPDEAEYERVKRVFHLTSEQLRHARPNLKVMHPLPRNKENLELDFSVDATPHAYYYRQAENGLAVRVTLLALLTGGIETPEHRRPAREAQPQRARFEPVEPGPGGKTRKYLFAIEDGTVIDHILPGRSGLVKSVLSLPEGVPVLVAENLESRRSASGRKDLIKIIGYKPSPTELSQIALISPGATISLIHDRAIVEKGRVVLPEYVAGLVLCQNPNCISRPEHLEGAPSLFRTISRTPPILQCTYCDGPVRQEDVAFLERG